MFFRHFFVECPLWRRQHHLSVLHGCVCESSHMHPKERHLPTTLFRPIEALTKQYIRWRNFVTSFYMSEVTNIVYNLTGVSYEVPSITEHCIPRTLYCISLSPRDITTWLHIVHFIILLAISCGGLKQNRKAVRVSSPYSDVQFYLNYSVSLSRFEGKIILANASELPLQ